MSVLTETRAPCVDHPTLTADAWTIADRGNDITPHDNIAAIAVCDTCPIKTACLDDLTKAGVTGVIAAGKGLVAGRGGVIHVVEPTRCQWCQRPFFPIKAGARYCGEMHRRAAEISRAAQRERDEILAEVAA
jgi:hypothetical protein